MSEKVIKLNNLIEYKNICKKCGAENTLYPHFIGRKTVRFCENCNQISTGITKAKYQEIIKKVLNNKKIPIADIPIRILKDKDGNEHIF